MDGETQHRGSSVAGDAGRPARAAQSARIHADVEIDAAVHATRSRRAAPSNDVGEPLREKRAAMARSGLSAGSSGSSGSSGSGPLGLICALLLIFLPRWFKMLGVPERWRTTVFLALRERPG
jgi:hypothetical protein